ncbi:MAG: hypothetical protein WC213_09030 [Arenimonas sp.]|jgi:hypothetical protein
MDTAELKSLLSDMAKTMHAIQTQQLIDTSAIHALLFILARNVTNQTALRRDLAEMTSVKGTFVASGQGPNFEQASQALDALVLQVLEFLPKDPE